MNVNISIFVLGVLFVILVIIKIIQNYKNRKSNRRRKSIFCTNDLINVLFNAGIITGGFASILIAFGYQSILFGSELTIAQPIINLLAGVLFVWFAIRNIFYGGQV